MKCIKDTRDKMLFYYKRLKQVEKALETGCYEAQIKIEHPDINLTIMSELITPEIVELCRQILIEKQKEYNTMCGKFSREYNELLLAQVEKEER